MGFPSETALTSEFTPKLDVPLAASVKLSNEVTSLIQPAQNFSAGQPESALYIDVPPIVYHVADAPGTGDSSGGPAPDTGTGSGDTTPNVGGAFDTTQSLEQLIASGAIGSNLNIRAAALLDEHQNEVSSVLQFLGINPDPAEGALRGVLGEQGKWPTKDSLSNPSTLMISIADPNQANFIIKADGSISCNKPPIAGHSLTIALADGGYGVTNAERITLKDFTDYLLSSLSSVAGAPKIDKSISDILSPAANNPANTPSPPGDSGNSGNNGSGSSGSGDGSGGGSGGSGGGNGGNSSTAPGSGGDTAPGTGGDTPPFLPPGGGGSSPISPPTDEQVIPQDTDSQQWLKAVDATVSGNGLPIAPAAERYSAVTDLGSGSGYGVGAYNSSAESIANWICNLSDEELNEIGDDEYDDGSDDGSTDSTTPDSTNPANTPANNGTKGGGAGGKAKANPNGGKTTGGGAGTVHHPRDAKHVFHKGTAKRLFHLREELRAFENSAQGNSVDLTKFLAQHGAEAATDPIVKLLADMTTPGAKDRVQADLKASLDPMATGTSLDPALQELMADDQLKIYRDQYKKNNPNVDLNNTADLNKAAGVLMLAMHLGHYPTDAEINADSDGIIKKTGAAVTPSSPDNASRGNAAILPISDQLNSGSIPHPPNTTDTSFNYTKQGLSLLNLSDPVDLVIAHVMSHEGAVTDITWKDAGSGVSVGMFGWNQGKPGHPGGLSDLLIRMNALSPGSVPPDIMAAINHDNDPKVDKKDRTAFGSLSFKDDRTLHQELVDLVNSPACAEAQVQDARIRVGGVNGDADIAKRLGLTSLGGVMLVTDMVNHFGQGSAELVALNAAKGVTGEGNKINSILKALQSGEYSVSHGYNTWYDKFYRREVNLMNDKKWFNYAYPFTR